MAIKKPELKDAKTNQGVRMTGNDVVQSGKNAGTTNANKRLPSIQEKDVVKSVKRDAETVRKTFDTVKGPSEGRVPTNAGARVNAGGRALARLGGRAAAGAAAFGIGYAAGRGIDNATGIGKKTVDAVAGKAIDEIAAPAKDRVKLAKDVPARLKAAEDASTISKDSRAARSTNMGKADSKQSFKEAFKSASDSGKKTFEWNGKKYTTEMADSGPKGSVREGENANIKDEDRNKAKESVAMAKGGLVKPKGTQFLKHTTVHNKKGR